MHAPDRAREEAIDWLVRLPLATDADWDAFTDWLAHDPAHRAAYDRVALADAALGSVLDGRSPPLPVVGPDRSLPPSEPTRRRHLARIVAGAVAVAAMLVLSLVSYRRLFPPDMLVAMESPPGRQRTLSLADGSHIFMNGGTRVLLDRERPRFARLDRGEASFAVVHDDGEPFTVAVGKAQVRDVGTVFNISRQEAGFHVAVAEGAVVFNPGAENIMLTRGRTLFVPTGTEPLTTGSSDPRAIGSWRRGELVYVGAPVAAVAADISRSLGTSVTVSPVLAGRPFTGVVRVDRDQGRFFRRLGGLLGTSVRRTGKGWRLGAA